MDKIISVTSGTLPVLKQIVRKFPKRQLNLYKSITENNFKLVDQSQNDTVFKCPVQYRIIQCKYPLCTGPFLNVIHLRLGQRDRKVLSTYIADQLSGNLPDYMINLFQLQNLQDPAGQSIILSWSRKTDYLTRLDRSFLQNFLENSSNNGFCNDLILI